MKQSYEKVYDKVTSDFESIGFNLPMYLNLTWKDKTI